MTTIITSDFVNVYYLSICFSFEINSSTQTFKSPYK